MSVLMKKRKKRPTSSKPMKLPLPEYRSTDSYHCGTFFDREREIFRHSHREFMKREAGPAGGQSIAKISKLAESPACLVWRQPERCHRHQAPDFEARQRQDRGQRRVQVGRAEPRSA